VKRFFGKILLLFLIAFIVVVAIVLFNTWRMSPEPIADAIVVTRDVDSDKASANLATAISFRTISTEPSEPDFTAFRDWLPATYPGVYETMEVTILGGGTVLLKWQGSDSSRKPVLLTGHYDVVPVNTATLNRWTHDPFAGTVADGFVWGRGALDNKGAVIAILEAAESLLDKGFQPDQTIYFSFGHDEEIGGNDGAASVVQYFKDNDIQLAWSLDEGSYLLDGIFPGLDYPVASINVAEKGFMTLQIKAQGEGGHSSIPPRETAVGTLAKAILKIQENPVPGKISGISESMFDGLAPHLGFTQRMMFANRWLFGSLLRSELSKSPSTNAMLRTTTAPTMLSGSTKENVLPTEAVASINFRIHPRDTPESVLQYIRDLVESDKVKVEILNGRGTPASQVASHDSKGYTVIAESIIDAYGSVITLPGLTIAGTDSKHYSKVADDAYRINPFIMTDDSRSRFHGIDERISVKSLEQGITAFMLLIEKL